MAEATSAFRGISHSRHARFGLLDDVGRANDFGPGGRVVNLDTGIPWDAVNGLVSETRDAVTFGCSFSGWESPDHLSWQVDFDFSHAWKTSRTNQFIRIEEQAPKRCRVGDVGSAP